MLLKSCSLRSWVGPTSNSLSCKGKLSYVICSKFKAASKSCSSSNSQVLYSGKYDVAMHITSVLQIQYSGYCCCLHCWLVFFHLGQLSQQVHCIWNYFISTAVLLSCGCNENATHFLHSLAKDLDFNFTFYFVYNWDSRKRRNRLYVVLANTRI